MSWVASHYCLRLAAFDDKLIIFCACSILATWYYFNYAINYVICVNCYSIYLLWVSSILAKYFYLVSLFYYSSLINSFCFQFTLFISYSLTTIMFFKSSIYPFSFYSHNLLSIIPNFIDSFYSFNVLNTYKLFFNYCSTIQNLFVILLKSLSVLIFYSSKKQTISFISF